jgi:hypothetical protein
MRHLKTQSNHFHSIHYTQNNEVPIAKYREINRLYISISGNNEI